jgi:hypothetical protein
MVLLLPPLAKTRQQHDGGNGDGSDGGNGGRHHCHCYPCGLQWHLMAMTMALWPLPLITMSLAGGGGSNGGRCCQLYSGV